MTALARFLDMDVGNAHPLYWVALVATVVLAVAL